MRELTYIEAINEALDEALAEDQTVFLLGEDIGVYGGGFGATKGLIEKYGSQRIRCTPISESAILWRRQLARRLLAYAQLLNCNSPTLLRLQWINL